VRRQLLAGRLPTAAVPEGSNTTLGVVATDATLTKAQANRLAQMAQDGLARALYPVHTPLDGDTLFTLATGRHSAPVDPGWLGALGAEAVAQAVLRAAAVSRGDARFPGIEDLRLLKSQSRTI
jgi:L-aminopeptidase/D-esterase-like protein